eukprot:gene11736-18095_t
MQTAFRAVDDLATGGGQSDTPAKAAAAGSLLPPSHTTPDTTAASRAPAGAALDPGTREGEGSNDENMNASKPRGDGSSEGNAESVESRGACGAGALDGGKRARGATSPPPARLPAKRKLGQGSGRPCKRAAGSALASVASPQSAGAGGRAEEGSPHVEAPPVDASPIGCAPSVQRRVPSTAIGEGSTRAEASSISRSVAPPVGAPPSAPAQSDSTRADTLSASQSVAPSAAGTEPPTANPLIVVSPAKSGPFEVSPAVLDPCSAGVEGEVRVSSPVFPAANRGLPADEAGEASAGSRRSSPSPASLDACHQQQQQLADKIFALCREVDASASDTPEAAVLRRMQQLLQDHSPSRASSASDARGSSNSKRAPSDDGLLPAAKRPVTTRSKSVSP